MARGQLGAHPQPALHARCARRRAHRGLPRRRILARHVQGHGGQDHRTPDPHGDPRVLTLPRLDAQPRRSLSALAVGHLAPVTHQCFFHGRGQSADQRLFPQRPKVGRGHRVRDRGGSPGMGRPALCRRLGGRAAVCRPCLRGRVWGLRVQHPLAARSLGPKPMGRVDRRQLFDPRHPLQHGRVAQAHARKRCRCHRRPHPSALRGH